MSFRRIKIESKGKIHTVLIDNKDYKLVSKYNWWLYPGHNGIKYVHAHVYKNGKRTTIRMHRLIMSETDPKILIDHQDRNGLNNRKSNLRKVSNGQNKMNSVGHKNSSSIYKGVHTNIVAHIRLNGKLIYLGSFDTEKEAAQIYDKCAIILFKEFALTNFDQESYSKSDIKKARQLLIKKKVKFK